MSNVNCLHEAASSNKLRNNEKVIVRTNKPITLPSKSNQNTLRKISIAAQGTTC